MNTTDSLVIPIGSTAVGNNGLADLVETSTDSDSINYESTYSLFAIANHLNVCADTDMDGIGDLVDIDDDNDGILDIEEQSSNCSYIGATDLTTLTFSSSQVGIDQFKDSIAIRRISGSWVTSYSDQAFEKPLIFEFTVSNANAAMMIGLIGNGRNQTPTNWNDQSHKFYFSSASAYDIRDYGGSSNAGSYVNGDKFKLTIDEDGNLSMEQNGNEVYADVVLDTEFQLSISTASTTVKPFYNITLGNTDNLLYVCDDLDTDSDGTPDRLDLDADNDGCYDISEGGAGFIGDSIVTQNAAFVSVGANGFANNLETATDNDSINYSLFPYYQDSLQNACLDHDGDLVGDLIDIDDDNDGILDTEEGLSCDRTFTSAEDFTYTKWISGNTTNNTATGNLNIDGNSITVNYSGDFRSFQSANSRMTGASHSPQAISTDTVIQTYNGVNVEHRFQFSQPIFNPILQVWSNNGNTYTFDRPVSIAQTGSISSLSDNAIRGNGEAGGSILIPGLVSEIVYTSSNLENWSAITIAAGEVVVFNSAGVPLCDTLDTDMDGIADHLDLDSDNDGCYDAYESNVTGTTNDGSSTDSLIATTNAQVGLNGLANSIETNDTDTATTNYQSTYNQYAVVDFLNAVIVMRPQIVSI